MKSNAAAGFVVGLLFGALIMFVLKPAPKYNIVAAEDVMFRINTRSGEAAYFWMDRWVRVNEPVETNLAAKANKRMD